jgi:hypothetical protein
MKSTKSSIAAMRSAGKAAIFLDQGLGVGGHVCSLLKAVRRILQAGIAVTYSARRAGNQPRATSSRSASTRVVVDQDGVWRAPHIIGALRAGRPGAVTRMCASTMRRADPAHRLHHVRF